MKCQSGEMSNWWDSEMVKWVVHAEIIDSVIFTFARTLHQQENTEGWFNREFLNNQSLEVGSNPEVSYSIWDSVEWDEEYGVI